MIAKQQENANVHSLMSLTLQPKSSALQPKAREKRGFSISLWTVICGGAAVTKKCKSPAEIGNVAFITPDHFFETHSLNDQPF